ncbi:hypothetical protein CF327_g3928 [Tilletia walkeri]|nr:hypothetical protein CF327_g3928 [Tilletia walkeri]
MVANTSQNSEHLWVRSLREGANSDVRKPAKYYAVADGRSTGVYDNWSDAKASTNGYSNNNHQSFRDAGEAQQYVDQGGAYSKQDWAQSQGGYSPNGYNPSGSSGNAKK